MSNKNIKNDPSLSAGSIRGYNVESTVPDDIDILVFDNTEQEWEPASLATISIVTGPSSATDNAIARFHLATGRIIQNSGITIDDSDNLLASTYIGKGVNFLEQTTVPYATSAGNSTLYSSNDATQRLLWVDDGSNEHIIGGKAYGCMYIDNSVTATSIEAQSQLHLFYNPDFQAGILSTHFTQGIGEVGTIGSVTDAGGGDITISSPVAHTISINDVVSITATTSYNNTYVVKAVGSSTTFDVTATYVATETGNFQVGSWLKCAQAGTYILNSSFTGKAETAGDTLYMGFIINSVISNETEVKRYFASSGKEGAWSISGLVYISANDFIQVGLWNETSAGDFTISHCNITAYQIDS